MPLIINNISKKHHGSKDDEISLLRGHVSQLSEKLPKALPPFEGMANEGLYRGVAIGVMSLSWWSENYWFIIDGACVNCRALILETGAPTNLSSSSKVDSFRISEATRYQRKSF
jgi:hypothetical protein